MVISGPREAEGPDKGKRSETAAKTNAGQADSLRGLRKHRQRLASLCSERSGACVSSTKARCLRYS